MPLQLFITGTNTGIGKTWVSAAIAAQALAQGQRVIYYKPIQTGSPPGVPAEDPAVITSLLDGKVPVYNRYCFSPPVAPAVADTDGLIDIAVIRQDVAHYASQCDLLLVEGAGGLAVPVTPSHLMVDVMAELGLPVVLVAHSQLGTINHTLLSVEALKNRNISLHGVVINFYPQHLTPENMAVYTLLDMLRHWLSPNTPLWTCLETLSETKKPPLFGLPISFDISHPTGIL